MSYKERLESIKYDFEAYRELSESDEKWLIEQAEKAEWIEKESNEIILEKTDRILELEKEVENLKQYKKVLMENSVVRSKTIEKYEEAIKNAIHFLEKNSGTYDEPRRLTIGEMTELYDLLNSQIKNK